MKRFWQEAAVRAGPDGFAVELDGRPLRTPGRAALAVPTEALAQAIADEWRAVDGDVDPRAMPLTGLANAAIDRVAPDPVAFAAGLARYGESDLLCYRADYPAPLVARQEALWDPPLDWARARFDVSFVIATGVIHRPQPAETLARLGEAIAARTPFELAALSPIVTATGSLVLAMALAEGALDGEAGWRSASADEDWQAEQWGVDELATRARAAHRADYDAGVRMLSLLRATA